jgi:uncharacterized membrane protein
MRVEESIEINRPVEEVFSYAADPKHFPTFRSGRESSSRCNKKCRDH